MSSSDIKKCENTFCKEYYKKVVELSEYIIKKTIEKKKDKYKELNKESLKIEKEKDKLLIREIKNKLKSSEFKKETKEICKTSYCNPKCKGTIFQNNKFPSELKEKYDNESLKVLIKLRKNLFKNKKSILKDDFYEKLNGIKNLKKKGAISGCATISFLRYK